MKLFDEWKRVKGLIEDRRPRWESLKELLSLAASLENVAAFRAQADAIRSGRQLLHDPDPVKPLAESVATERWDGGAALASPGIVASAASARASEKKRIRIGWILERVSERLVSAGRAGARSRAGDRAPSSIRSC